MKPTIERLQDVRLALHNALDILDGDRSDVAGEVRGTLVAAQKVNDRWIADWAKRQADHLLRGPGA